MTVAPAAAAAARFCDESGAQRKLGSSKKPIGIRVAAPAVVADTASSATSATRTKRAALSTGKSLLVVVGVRRTGRGSLAPRFERPVKSVRSPSAPVVKRLQQRFFGLCREVIGA